MIGASRSRKRITVALWVLCLVFGISNLAIAEPEDEVIAALLHVEDVVATGIGPQTIFVTWADTSIAHAQFAIQIATDELGPWETARTAFCRGGPNVTDPTTLTSALGNRCSTVISSGPPSDTATRFVRVVPMLSTPTLTGIGNINIPGEVLYEGTPSDPDPALLAPPAPTNLLCNGGGEYSCTNVSSITLTWDDNSDEQAFWIMRARGFINPGYGVTPYAVLPPNTTSFSEILPDFSIAYWYSVVAVRMRSIVMLNGDVIEERAMASSNTVNGNNGDPNGPGNIKVETPPIAPPTDPGGLTAVFTAPSTATLTWNDPQLPIANPPYNDEDGWFIEFGPSPEDMDFDLQRTRQRFVGQSNLSDPDPARRVVKWVDNSIPPDTLRCYRVRGYRGVSVGIPAMSAFSPRTAADGVCVGSIPKAVTALRATAISNTQVDLLWVDNSTTEQEFVVQRCNGTCTPSSTWTTIDSNPMNDVTYSDMNTVASTTYSYRVIARNSSGSAAPSNIATVTTKVAPLAKPTGLTAVAISSSAIQLAWNDVVGATETGYQIEYRSGTEWLELKVLSGFPGADFPDMAQPMYLDRDTLRANQERCYRVRAVKNAGVSDPSNVACATTQNALAPNGDPTGLTATPNSNTKITLAWSDNATNEDYYRVDYVAYADKHCASLPADTASRIASGAVRMSSLTKAPASGGTGPVSFNAGGLIPHSAYFFRVQALNGDGISAPSNISGCAQTYGPAAPIILDDEANQPDPQGERVQENGDTDAMRCEIRIKTPAWIANESAHPVARLRVMVSATVGEVNDNDTFFVPPTTPTANPNEYRPGYTWEIDSQGIWHVTYKFLRGPNYGIRVTAFQQGNDYSSVESGVRDLRVVADCPLGSDPLPDP